MPTSSRRHWRGNPFPLCGVVRAPRPTSCAVTLRRGRRPRRPVSRGLILPCRGGRLCPPCMTVAPCRAGPMCPAAGYAFFGGARGPRPTGRYVEPRVGDGVPTSRQRAAPRQSVPLPQISVKITTTPCQILCTHTKCENFAGNGCAGGGGVLYSDRQSHTRAAPMGAGFFSYLFRKRITGRLRNKF